MRPKLVRDNIPQIIKDDNQVPVTRIASDEEYTSFLKEKLLEEVNEFLESEEVEELADILEVLHSYYALKGISKEEVEALRLKKAQERGGFTKRIILNDIK